MQTISTTQLRTRSKDLVKALDKGRKVDLIHRSRLIGEISPKEEVKTFNVKRFTKIANKLNLPHLTEEEREKRYRQAMDNKHGIRVS